MQKQEFTTEIKGINSSETDLLLTIFYNDIHFRRKFITCSVQIEKVQIEGEQKIDLTIKYIGHTKNLCLHPSISLGNIIVFLRHSFTNSIELNNIENLPLQEGQSNQPDLGTSQQFIFFDCQIPLIELVNKSFNTEIIFIKNKQNLLFALISTNKNSQDHYRFTEPFVLIEKIMTHIEYIFKREFKKDFKTYNQKGPTIWKNYIQYFEKHEINKFDKTHFDQHYFIKMLRDINHIVNLLCINHQIFISERDLFILKDSEIFTAKLKELLSNAE